MQFISWQFIIFFIIAMLLLLSKNRHKRIFLLSLNVIFYLYSGVGGFINLIIFTIVTYIGGRMVYKNKNKLLFAVFLIIALFPLVFYKYTDFVIRDCLHLSEGILYKYSIPIGISFITFQGIGYLVDVFKGKCESEKNILDYFIYLSLFTSVTSGPINRSEQILKQIKLYNNKGFDYNRCVQGFRYILLGIFLKLLISGRMSQVVSLPFSNPESSGGFVLLIASICFTIQIFCDFCGYSYMAYGLSKVIGIDVVQNFERPYYSCTITEFWRRWHISLSSWLKDYIYIPLGGSRCSKIRTYFNLLVTFLVSGLWHGAAWNYVFWGLLNGICLVVEKVTGLNKGPINKCVKIIRRIIMLIILNFMWIFFRSETLADAFLIIYKIVFETVENITSSLSLSGILNIVSGLGVTVSEFIAVVISVGTFMIYELLIDRRDNPISFFDNKHTTVRWIKYMTLIFIMLIVGATGQAGEFIYASF